jgi:RNA methyltransferase, TrmH family
MLSKSQVKYIQSLAQKKFRDADGVFVIEGPKLLEEFLKINRDAIINIYALESWTALNIDLGRNLMVTEVSEIELSKISSLKTPNEVLALVKQRKVDFKPDLNNRITIALDSIRDPGNLGTIIRTADWFGVKNIICSKDCADCYNSKVVQSTMGSIGRVNIIYDDLKTRLKQYGHINIYAADLDGADVRAMEKPEAGIIVIGNESKGVSPEIEQLVTGKITIPRIGKAESLNAAVATAIILSHLS